MAATIQATLYQWQIAHLYYIQTLPHANCGINVTQKSECTLSSLLIDHMQFLEAGCCLPAQNRTAWQLFLVARNSWGKIALDSTIFYQLEHKLFFN